MRILRLLLAWLLGLSVLTAMPQTVPAAMPQIPPVAAPKSITVVLDDNYPPYLFRDANGQIQGILKDRWALWQARTGIAVKLQASDWASALRTMQAGQADVIDTIFSTPERKKLYAFSAPYAQIDVALFFHRSISGITDAKSARGFTVGVKDGDACVGLLRSQGVDSVKPYADYSAVVAAAVAGEVHVFCMDMPAAIYLLTQRGVDKDFRFSPPIALGQLHWAVRQGDPVLLGTVAAGFERISAAELQQIDRKWLGSSMAGQPGSPYSRYAGYAAWSAALLALLLVLWNLTLRRRVRDRTRSLSDSLAALTQNRKVLEKALREHQAMIDNDMIGFIKLAQRQVVWANPAAEKTFGYGQGELVGRSTCEIYPSQQAYEELLRQADPVMQAGQVFRAQIEFRRRDGAVIWIELGGAMLARETGESLWIFLDVTERKSADDRLRQLSRSVEQAPVAIVITDLAGTILYANPHFSRNTGYTLEEAQGQNPRMLKSGQTPPEVYRELWDTLCAGGVWQGELHNRRKNGELFVEHAVIAPVQGADGKTSHYVAIKEDITQRKQADLALQATLKEKVALLHEVHHRVKNNLQVITSLLRLEAGRSGEPATRKVLKEMQGRIYAMALLHETLYRAGTFASVDLAAYLKQLASQAFRAQGNPASAVRLLLDLAPVQVLMDQATPCGLLVNELLSNCLKHGFPDGRSGEVLVRLQPEPQAGMWRLVVSDTGVGLPADFEIRRTQSLGLQLVSDLARQLGGGLQVGPVGAAGSVFSVVFAVQVFHRPD
jgi:PAS domain S-box-containing protein